METKNAECKSNAAPGYPLVYEGVFDDGPVLLSSPREAEDFVTGLSVCATCRFCSRNFRWYADDASRMRFERCECHRNPPTATGFPAVDGDDWCGAYLEL